MCVFTFKILLDLLYEKEKGALKCFFILFSFHPLPLKDKIVAVMAVARPLL